MHYAGTTKACFIKFSSFQKLTGSDALTGCCAVAAHVDGPHLHVANSGDCGAVLGTQNEDGTWEAKRLTQYHNVANKVERV